MGDFASQHHSLTLFLLWSKHGQLMGCVALCQLISSTSWNSVRRRTIAPPGKSCVNGGSPLFRYYLSSICANLIVT